MGFGEAIRVCFSKYADFSGRASRSEYWFFVLFSILVNFGARIVDAVLMAGMRPMSTPSLPWRCFSRSLRCTCADCTTYNRSGWWLGGLYIFMPPHWSLQA